VSTADVAWRGCPTSTVMTGWRWGRTRVMPLLGGRQVINLPLKLRLPPLPWLTRFRAFSAPPSVRIIMYTCVYTKAYLFCRNGFALRLGALIYIYIYLLDMFIYYLVTLQPPLIRSFLLLHDPYNIIYNTYTHFIASVVAVELSCIPHYRYRVPSTMVIYNRKSYFVLSQPKPAAGERGTTIPHYDVHAIYFAALTEMGTTAPRTRLSAKIYVPNILGSICPERWYFKQEDGANPALYDPYSEKVNALLDRRAVPQDLPRVYAAVI